jgi:hypothetical protein
MIVLFSLNSSLGNNQSIVNCHYKKDVYNQIRLIALLAVVNFHFSSSK